MSDHFRRVISSRRLRAKYTPRTSLRFVLSVLRSLDNLLNLRCSHELIYLLIKKHIQGFGNITTDYRICKYTHHIFFKSIQYSHFIIIEIIRSINIEIGKIATQNFIFPVLNNRVYYMMYKFVYYSFFS